MPRVDSTASGSTDKALAWERREIAGTSSNTELISILTDLATVLAGHYQGLKNL